MPYKDRVSINIPSYMLYEMQQYKPEDMTWLEYFRRMLILIRREAGEEEDEEQD